jgi:superfamily I DNA and RNA helicase
MSFHQLCDWRIKVIQSATGTNLLREAETAYSGSSLFEVQMPYALARTTELDGFRYQAIVVDEGQDFGDEYWLPIEFLLEDVEDTPLYLFFDPNQAVYRNASTFPIQDAPFMLTENCRNTRNIHSVAYKFYDGDEVDPPDVEGVPTQILEAEGIDQQARKIRNKVSELLSKEQLSAQDVVILVLGDKKTDYYKALQKAGNPTGATWSFEALWKAKTVLVDTAKRFKGLESGVVLLWGIEQVTPKRDKEILYVALSRARSRLFLVGTNDAVKAIV